MKIGPQHQADIISDDVRQIKDKIEKTTQGLHQKDTVEISSTGREKLQELADSKAENAETVREPKLVRVKNKIAAGYYDLPEVQEKILERLTAGMMNEINDNLNME